MNLQSFATPEGLSPTLIARALRTTKAEIADTLGLGADALSRRERIASPKVQTRLREMMEILNRVEAQVGSPLVAYAWFRSQPLPGFANQTPRQLVLEGNADWVHDHLRSDPSRRLCLSPAGASRPRSIARMIPAGPGIQHRARELPATVGASTAAACPALYTALDPITAVREVSELGAPMQPVTLCQYEVDCHRIFDATDQATLAAEAVDVDMLACPNWERDMLAGGVPASQALADRLIARGYCGMIVRSFAQGSGAGDRNVRLLALVGGAAGNGAGRGRSAAAGPARRPRLTRHLAGGRALWS